MFGWCKRTRVRPDVLVIVPAYRNPRQLARCLTAVSEQTVSPRIETYVRDNSDDNILFTAAINEGLRHGLANDDFGYFLILNQDCYLKHDAVEHLAAFMEQHPEVGICAPIQLDSEDSEQVIWGGAGRSFPYGQAFMGPLKDVPGPFETPWASGAAAMIRRETVVGIGLMDENMRFICSDSDYSFTARARGWKIVCVPAARCIHEMGAAKAPASAELRAVMRHDVDYFADKWITGNLFLRLELDPEQRDVTTLRGELDVYVGRAPARPPNEPG